MQTLPEAFVRQLTISLGPERAGEVVSFITGSPASTAVRINPFKVNAFPAQFASGRETFSRWGRLLDGRPEFALDPLFHAGAYYVQEASSMYLESILPLMLRMREERPEGPFAVLDLCAAPGGKSTHLLSMLREIPGSFLVSNEVIRSRASVLCENIAKWGAANVVVTNDDPADFSPWENISTSSWWMPRARGKGCSVSPTLAQGRKEEAFPRSRVTGIEMPLFEDLHPVL